MILYIKEKWIIMAEKEVKKKLGFFGSIGWFFKELIH